MDEAASGSYYCLAEYRGQYVVVLRGEEYYTDTFKEDGIVTDMDTIFRQLRRRAGVLSKSKVFAGTKILISEDIEHGELIILIPWDAPKERIREIADFLKKTAYDVQEFFK